LLGDYQQVNPSQNFAQGNAMVHIRAVPGGSAEGAGATPFRRTFYSRFQNGGNFDRRQPLPSTFATRWISGGSSGFSTTFKIWREAVTGANAGCAVSPNALITLSDIVRFDEDENASEIVNPCCCILCPPFILTLPTVARIPASYEIFPPNPDAAVAGWMYMNLENPVYYGQPQDDVALQNWVIVSMAAEGRYSVDFDASSLGNGCSRVAPVTDEDGDPPAIGPAPNTNP
jgi:hypothetical protein